MEDDSRNILIGLVLIILVAIGGFFLYTEVIQEEDDDTEETQEEMNDDSNNEETPQEEATITDLAVQTANLSTLVTAITEADLVATFDDPQASFTVFAPTNTAFSAIQDTVNTLLEPENQEDLVNVLQYHVVSGEAMASDLSDGQELTTLNGETLTVEIDGGNVYILDNNGNRAMVTNADIEASNGVVHIIDTVLIP